MKCPHCSVEIHPSFNQGYIQKDKNGDWGIKSMVCPSCEKLIIILAQGKAQFSGQGTYYHFTGMKDETTILAHPKSISRPISELIPDKYAQDFREACLVVNDSPKASAALCRRCLQNIIRNELGIKKKLFSQEVNEVIEGKKLPSFILEDLDAVRNVGNYAAHATVDNTTGIILDVAPEEAEWLLNILESLFIHLFVEPAEAKKRRDKLNEKLKTTGRKPMIKPKK